MNEDDTLNEIKVAVEEPQSWARRLTITVPASRMERERRDVTSNLARRIRLPGFRKGKVPPGIVERRFAAAIDQETIERVVGNAYREALEKHSFRPITRGAVGDVEYSPGSDLTFRVDFEIQPEIQLERLGGFRLTRQQAEVTEEAVEEVIERLRRDNADWVPLPEGATPQVDDLVHIEIAPLTDEGTPEAPREYRIVLGQGHAVQDIEDAIRTLQPGQEGEFRIRLAAEEGEAEPREQTVRLKVLDARRPQPPELDDAFASKMGDFQTLADLRDAVRSDLEKEAAADAERKLRQDLLDELITANPFEVAQSLVNSYIDRLLSSSEGLDEARLAELRQVAEPAAERAIKRSLIIERVAELHGLGASPEEVDERVEAIAQMRGRPVSEVWAQLQKSGRLSAIEEEITEDKVFQFLLAQSTVE
ncbi:MAG TPA: trigger factor [Longimicrobiales bacterium]|nr:trigger factor [Longimicrobiales bacterium]